MTRRAVRAVVTDIEGTTSSISFVHDVLFPYARAHLPDYVRTHAAALGDILAAVGVEEGRGPLSIDDCVAVLLQWIDEDRKATPLKTLQGRVWAQGYAQGAFKGHVYGDVPPNLKKWRGAGIGLYVYSSGSVAAQRQIFGFSEQGDLTPLFSGYFDTTTGGKKQAASYEKIAQSIELAPAQILFLSDSADELKAAEAAGWQVLGLTRPGIEADIRPFRAVSSFDEIILEPEAQGISREASLT